MKPALPCVPRRRLALALAASLAASTSACQWAFHGEPFIKSELPPPVTFTHKRHIEAKIDCLTCHEGIFESASSTGSTLPKRKVCKTCHEDAEVARDAPELDGMQPHRAGLYFSHEAHLPRVEENCLGCHAGIVKATRFGPETAPDMDTCTSCHKTELVKNECVGCHVRDRLVKIRPVRFLGHEGDWVQHHSDRARSNSAACAQCHAQSYCGDCHDRYQTLKPSTHYAEQVSRQLIHRGDYLSRHALEATGNSGQCLTCHSVSRCDSCHVQQGVSYAGAISREQSLPRTPHPLAFMDRAAPEFHGRAARRDVVACASCHDQGPVSNCVSCHQSGRLGGNPHPQRFTSDQNRAATPMCQWCHGGR